MQLPLNLNAIYESYNCANLYHKILSKVCFEEFISESWSNYKAKHYMSTHMLYHFAFLFWPVAGHTIKISSHPYNKVLFRAGHLLAKIQTIPPFVELATSIQNTVYYAHALLVPPVNPIIHNTRNVSSSFHGLTIRTQNTVHYRNTLLISRHRVEKTS